MTSRRKANAVSAISTLHFVETALPIRFYIDFNAVSLYFRIVKVLKS